MEHLGILSLFPPLLIIFLALVTKEVIFSLFAGIFFGYLLTSNWNPLVAMIKLTDGMASVLSDSWNIRIIIFTTLLAAMVGLFQATGAAKAFGGWMASKVKSRLGTLIVTWLFGIFIFFDDYFNCLTIGTVMRPVTDEQKISRAKLAYIIDSTTAPMAILAPVSTWVVTIMSVIKNSEGFPRLNMNEFIFFLLVIPINLYAILAILMVFMTIVRGDWGPMKDSESRALSGKGLFNPKFGQPIGEVSEEMGHKAKPFDMVVPLTIFVSLAILFFPITAYLDAIDGDKAKTFWEATKTMSFWEAFMNTDSSKAFSYAAVFSLVFTSLYFMLRRVLTIQEVGNGIILGIKSLVPALVILSLAWTVGNMIKNPVGEGGLGLAKYLSHVVSSGHFPAWLLPFIVFLISSAISFSTGTSWGTFMIMIPIVMPIAVALSEKFGINSVSLATISVGAVLGGSVFGDHCSPISDTTILSSTGAGCPHIEHVVTQIPYAVFVMVVSAIGYLVAGITTNATVGLVTATIVFFFGYELVSRYARKFSK